MFVQCESATDGEVDSEASKWRTGVDRRPLREQSEEASWQVFLHSDCEGKRNGMFPMPSSTSESQSAGPGHLQSGGHQSPGHLLG